MTEYEYAWKDPDTGRMWHDGWEPVKAGLIRVRRAIPVWEEVP